MKKKKSYGVFLCNTEEDLLKTLSNMCKFHKIKIIFNKDGTIKMKVFKESM